MFQLSGVHCIETHLEPLKGTLKRFVEPQRIKNPQSLTGALLVALPEPRKPKPYKCTPALNHPTGLILFDAGMPGQAQP